MNTYHLSIKNWAVEDRPREKMLKKGLSSLSDAELLAILLVNGGKSVSALDLAKAILAQAENNLNVLAKKDIADLQKVSGIGPAKAVTILAAIELGRRRSQQPVMQQISIKGSKDVAEYFQAKLADLQHEEFWVLLLNRANRIIHSYRLSQGGISGTVIDVRLLMKEAMNQLASSIIVCHNHPSGSLQPSSQDISLTKKIAEASKMIDIPLIDHLIVSNSGYYSFADEGMI
jgi:DNA repair protein RadC